MEIRNFSEFLLEKKKDKSGSDDSAPSIKDMSKKEIKSLKVDDSVSDEDGEIEAHGFKIVVDNKEVKSKENIVDPKDPKIWKPGDGSWFLEYYSQIKSEKDPVNIIKVTEEILLKLGKEGFSKIDSSFKWEKLYQFAKYCLKGEEINYPELVRNIPKDKQRKDSKPGLLSEILGIDVDGKTIDKILSNDVKNDGLADYTKGIYDGIKAFITSPKQSNVRTEVTIKNLFGGGKPKELDDLGVISLLAGLYQPLEGGKGKPIFITESTPDLLKTPGTGWNGETVTDEGKKDASASEWVGWSIPVEPLRIKNLMQQIEMCLRSSTSCIKQIIMELPTDEKTVPNKAVAEIEGITTEMRKEVIALLGENLKEDGTAQSFWAEWGATGATESDKIKLIKGGKGFTNEIHLKFLEDVGLTKDKIQKAKDLVDSGEMSKQEYIDNVKEYTKDNEDKKVTVGEGLRKVMYEEIKDGISDLQAAVDNYTSAPGEKNALDQYLKVYNEFIDKTKSNYTISGKADARKIEVKKQEK